MAQLDILPTEYGDTSLVKIETMFGELYDVVTPASSSTAGAVVLREDTDNGTNKVTLIAPSSIASDKTITLPDETGTVLTSASLDTDGTLAANSDTKIASQKATKTYVDKKKPYMYIVAGSATNGIAGTITDINGLTQTFTPTVASTAYITANMFVDVQSAGIIDAILTIADSSNTVLGLGRFIATGTGVRGNAVSMCSVALTANTSYTFKCRATGTAGQTFNTGGYSFMKIDVIPT